jgi:hypothetical protein
MTQFISSLIHIGHCHDLGNKVGKLLQFIAGCSHCHLSSRLINPMCFALQEYISISTVLHFRVQAPGLTREGRRQAQEELHRQDPYEHAVPPIPCDPFLQCCSSLQIRVIP